MAGFGHAHGRLKACRKPPVRLPRKHPNTVSRGGGHKQVGTPVPVDINGWPVIEACRPNHHPRVYGEAIVKEGYGSAAYTVVNQIELTVRVEVSRRYGVEAGETLFRSEDARRYQATLAIFDPLGATARLLPWRYHPKARVLGARLSAVASLGVPAVGEVALLLFSTQTVPTGVAVDRGEGGAALEAGKGQDREQ